MSIESTWHCKLVWTPNPSKMILIVWLLWVSNNVTVEQGRRNTAVPPLSLSSLAKNTMDQERIFRHADVSSTYPCMSVRWLVGRWYFRIFSLSASLVSLREKLKREDPNYFCVFSECVFSKSVFSKSVFFESVFFESVFFESVFSESVFFESVFSKSVFSESVFSESVFFESVFSKNVFFKSVFSKSVFLLKVYFPKVYFLKVYFVSLSMINNTWLTHTRWKDWKYLNHQENDMCSKMPCEN